MDDTAFLRSDELPGRAALGYLDERRPRTNVLHLPVRGNGDGGIYSTAADISCALARALRRADRPARLGGGDGAAAERRARAERGATASASGSTGRATSSSSTATTPGVSFMSTHDPASATTRTVISNTSEGAWDMAKLLNGEPA